MKKQLKLAAIALLLTASCFPDVGEGKAKATVSSPTPEPSPVVKVDEPVTARTITIDAATSKIAAVGAKVTGKHDIAFDKWKGTLAVTGAELTGIEVEIEMASLRADVDKLTGHLQSADFFDVAKFPTARFSAKKIVKSSGDGTTHKVTGDLTMHGVTKEISFPARIAVGANKVEATAEFVINRKDFGIVYPGMPDDLIKDEVALSITLNSTHAGA